MVRSKLHISISVLVLAAVLVALLALFIPAPFLYARAEEPAKIVLSSDVQCSAQSVREGVYRKISAGDTVKITYALLQNDGLRESVWTPLYDRNAFELTSFKVDRHWTLFNEYPYEENGQPVTKTVEQHIALFNAAVAAGEADENEYLSFDIYTDLKDDVRLSSSFITITYTALTDLVAPLVTPLYTFGFDMRNEYLGGARTNAAATGEQIMQILFKTGETELGADILTPVQNASANLYVRAELIAAFGEQDVSLVSGTVRASDLLIVYSEPALDPETQENRYLADGGSPVFYFYNGDPENGGVLLTDPALPTETGVYYAYARFPDTERFDGLTTSVVIVTVTEEQFEYDFSFRAALQGNLSSEKYLTWDASAKRFVLSDSASAFTFIEKTPIPRRDGVSYFRINRWLAVSQNPNEDPVYTEVALFDANDRADQNKYYLAEMVFDVGYGDLNGDGSVNVDDVYWMKRAVVDTIQWIETPEAAWALTGNEKKILFSAAKDVNGDSYADARDVVLTLEALVGGYSYEIVKDATAAGKYISGESVVSASADKHAGFVLEAQTKEEVLSLIRKNIGVLLTADLDLSSEDLLIEFVGDIVIDLGGKTLSADHLKIKSRATITICNGTLVGSSIFVRAPGGVYLKNLSGIEDTDGSVIEYAQ